MHSAHLKPAGLHPTLSIRAQPTHAHETTCALWTLIELPAQFIPDRFQLDQLHQDGRLGSQSTSTPSLIVAGPSARDLESPESRAGPTSVLLRLAAGDRKGKGSGVEVNVPLHMRYLVPVEQRWSETGARMDLRTVELPSPRVFFACRLGDLPPADLAACSPTSESLRTVPAHTISVHFLPATSPSHSLSLAPCAPQRAPLYLTLPTGVLADLPFVESANVALVWAGALWLACVAYGKRKRARAKVE